MGDRVRIIDEQDATGRTTYQVVVDHMDHGVVVCTTDDADRASEIEFVLSHEFAELEAELARLTEANRWIPMEERLPARNQKVLGVPRGIPDQVDSGLWGVDFDEATHSHWRARPKGPTT